MRPSSVADTGFHDFTPEEAVKWTLHSWRHLLPTASRQLRHPAEETNQIGHWAVGSQMPRRYDGALCCAELMAKADIRDALANGWSVAPAGEVPMPKPKRRRTTPTGTSLEVVTPERANPGPAPLMDVPRSLPANVATSECELPRVRRVLHKDKLRFHYWKDKQRSLCGCWTCGTPDEPVPSAVFVTHATPIPPETSMCKPCASRAALESGWSNGVFSADVEEEAPLPVAEFLPEVPQSPDLSEDYEG